MIRIEPNSEPMNDRCDECGAGPWNRLWVMLIGRYRSSKKNATLCVSCIRSLAMQLDEVLKERKQKPPESKAEKADRQKREKRRHVARH